MSRYKNTAVKINKENGSRVYGLTLYPTIPIQDGDEFIYPFDGERVETIAYKYYQDTSLWWIIAGANNLRDGGFALDPTKELRIPKNIQPILEEFRRLNEEFQSR
tara:strand:- start:197 stop:511 length:315 start_codon:yes stop_codon:yes gene_type:complete